MTERNEQILFESDGTAVADSNTMAGELPVTGRTGPATAHQLETEDPLWTIHVDGFDPSREREVESIFAMGNGYCGVRGSLDMPIPISQADLFVAGIYDAKAHSQPYSEVEFLVPRSTDTPHAYTEIVPLPFPFRLKLQSGEQVLAFTNVKTPAHRSCLDLKKGMTFEDYDFKSIGCALTMHSMRFCSLSEPHNIYQEITISSHESSPIPISIDFSLKVPELSSNHPHLVPLEPKSDASGPAELLCFGTRVSRELVVYATRLFRDRVDDSDELESPLWSGTLEPGQTLRFRRRVTVFTSRDLPVQSPDELPSGKQEVQSRVEELALKEIQAFSWRDFDLSVLSHVQQWQRVWENADLVIEGNPRATQAQRFNTYHLMIAGGNETHSSIGARTLTGRAYEGHIFWDVEAFMLPFFTAQFPHLARSLLRYRYRTLNGARKRAAEFGCRGACYPWESTVTGADVTPRSILLTTAKQLVPIFTGTQQIHVTADVALGISRYWSWTGDDDFMREMGAEILFETARFWVSRSARDGDRFRILGVVGPDEYHHSVNDNAFTNWMAHFNVEAALNCRDWLARHAPERLELLIEKLGLSREEFASWQTYLEQLFLPRPGPDGVIEQFEGFFSLRPAPFAAGDRFRAPYQRLLNWKEISDSRVIKQADVLMLFFLFPDKFDRSVIEANFRYYEPLTDHASSLSPPVHAMVASLIGWRKKALEYFEISQRLDLENRMSNTALGIHAACIGACWQAVVFGFCGIRTGSELFTRDPALPESWKGIRLSLGYRGERTHYAISERRAA